jgi:hypothetical protein
MLRIEAEKQGSQDVVYKSGLPIVTSAAANSQITLKPAEGRYGMQDRVSYAVEVRNLGRARIEVGEGSVRAWANGEPAAVLSGLLRTTLEQGETASGLVVLDTTRWRACPTVASRRLNQPGYRVAGPCRWVVVIAAGGDLHSFTFNEALETR